MKKRDELKFQTHLVKSYASYGGFAKKWASEWQGGVPDLVCSLPMIGLHLIEVKHRPSFGPGSDITNPMEKLQIEVGQSYAKAGAVSLLCVIGGDTDALKSVAYFFRTDPHTGAFPARIGPATAFYYSPYLRGFGYNVSSMACALKETEK